MAIKKRKKLIITFAVIVILIAAAFVGCRALTSFDVTTDLSHYVDKKEFEGHSGLRIFPDEVRKKDAMEYYYAHRYILFDPDIQLYLRCKYTPQNYAKECERLSRVSVSYDGRTNTVSYNTNDYAFPAYEAIRANDCTYEYALLNEEEYTIDYVYLQFIPEEDVVFDHEKLPEGYRENDSGTESLENLNIYQFKIDLKGEKPDFDEDFDPGYHIEK